MSRGIASWLGLILFLGIAGCKSVEPEDVVGTWALQSDARRNLPSDLQSANATFVFKQDGTFICSDIPGLLQVPGQSSPGLEAGRGNWRLIRSEGNQEVQLD